MKNFLRDLWTRAFLRGLHYHDRHDQLDTLYRLENPWRLDSTPEQTRFRLTNELIQREFGRVGRLLEIGSGEGHQSIHLGEVCEHLFGVEISARAVERARARCPQATFFAGDLNSVGGATGSYDLVTACEVIYYMSDVQGTLTEMSRLGRTCLVTYFQTQQQAIDATVTFPPQAIRDTMVFEDMTWTAVWWTNPGTDQAR